jgi:CheY-like chemotaxis protein
VLGARILIVEDERIIAADLTQRVNRLGFQVIATVGSGVEAIEQARQSRPDLVLMDIGLPGEIDGLEAGACIWGELQIPIVYVTAYADAQTMAQRRTPEPMFAIHKPFDASQIRATLEQALAPSH